MLFRSDGINMVEGEFPPESLRDYEVDSLAERFAGNIHKTSTEQQLVTVEYPPLAFGQHRISTLKQNSYLEEG